MSCQQPSVQAGSLLQTVPRGRRLSRLLGLRGSCLPQELRALLGSVQIRSCRLGAGSGELSDLRPVWSVRQCRGHEREAPPGPPNPEKKRELMGDGAVRGSSQQVAPGSGTVCALIRGSQPALMGYSPVFTSWKEGKCFPSAVGRSSLQ